MSKLDEYYVRELARCDDFTDMGKMYYFMLLFIDKKNLWKEFTRYLDKKWDDE